MCQQFPPADAIQYHRVALLRIVHPSKKKEQQHRQMGRYLP